jgi:hypothetical protein
VKGEVPSVAEALKSNRVEALSAPFQRFVGVIQHAWARQSVRVSAYPEFYHTYVAGRDSLPEYRVSEAVSKVTGDHWQLPWLFSALRP